MIINEDRFFCGCSKLERVIQSQDRVGQMYKHGICIFILLLHVVFITYKKLSVL